MACGIGLLCFPVEQVEGFDHLVPVQLQPGIGIAPPSGRHEPVQAEPGGTKGKGEIDERFEFVQFSFVSVTRTPHRSPASLQAANAADRLSNAPGHIPEPVMGLCPCTVKRDPGILDPALFDPAGNVGGDQRPVGAERHLEPPVPCMACQFPDILPHQGFTAGEEDERDAHIRKVVDDRQRLSGREFPLRRSRPGPDLL